MRQRLGPDAGRLRRGEPVAVAACPTRSPSPTPARLHRPGPAPAPGPAVAAVLPAGWRRRAPLRSCRLMFLVSWVMHLALHPAVPAGLREVVLVS